MTIPLHGKYSYVRIRKGILENDANNTEENRGWKVVSFATDYQISLEQQNIARAIVLGTDGILDIQSQGLLATATINLIMTDQEDTIIHLLGGDTENVTNNMHGGNAEVDYNQKIKDAVAGTSFDGTVTVDVQIIPINTFMDFSRSDILGEEGGSEVHGYVFELMNAVLRSLVTGGNAGDYDRSVLTVEANRFVVSNFRAPPPQP